MLFRSRVSRETIGDLHHLFLVDDHAERLFQNLFQFGKFILNFAPAMFALDEVVDHAALDRSGTIKRVKSR